MAFKASNREVGELYTFFKMLTTCELSMATPKVVKDPSELWSIALLQRDEHDGVRRYYIEKEQVRISNAEIDVESKKLKDVGEPIFIPREDFAEAGKLLLDLLKTPSDSEQVEMTDELEGFLDAVKIFDLEAKTDDRPDLRIAFWSVDA